MRPLYIGVIGFSAQKFNIKQAFHFMIDALKQITEEHPNNELIIVSGLTSMGIPLVAYIIADRMGFKTIGIAPKVSEQYSKYPVTKEIIKGDNWGDESDFFVSVCDVVIRIGGGDQTNEELEKFKEKGCDVYEYDFETDEIITEKTEIISPEELKKLSFIKDIQALKKHSIDLINSSRTKPEKKSYLIRQIQNAHRVQDVQGIIWNTLLSGEGLSTTTSTYQKNFK